MPVQIVFYARISSLNEDNKYRQEELADFQARYNKARFGNKWLTVDANKQILHETFRDFELMQKNRKID